jgi:hypothetical protein
MPSIPELLSGHVTLEVECLDRLYLNGYVGPLATPGGLVTFMREQLGKPAPSPVVLGQVAERFCEAVKVMVERQQIPLYQFKPPGAKGRCRKPDAPATRRSRWDRVHRSGTREGAGVSRQEDQWTV